MLIEDQDADFTEEDSSDENSDIASVLVNSTYITSQQTKELSISGMKNQPAMGAVVN